MHSCVHMHACALAYIHSQAPRGSAFPLLITHSYTQIALAVGAHVVAVCGGSAKVEALRKLHHAPGQLRVVDRLTEVRFLTEVWFLTEERFLTKCASSQKHAPSHWCAIHKDWLPCRSALPHRGMLPHRGAPPAEVHFQLSPPPAAAQPRALGSDSQPAPNAWLFRQTAL